MKSLLVTSFLYIFYFNFATSSLFGETLKPFSLCQNSFFPRFESSFFLPFEDTKLPKGPLFFAFNSGNKGKLKDYRKLFNHHSIPINLISKQDQEEIDADEISVIVHKASLFTPKHGIGIVDDSILQVEGGDFGVHIKWRLRELEKFIGKKASFSSFLGLRYGNEVYVFRGTLDGKIVSPRGKVQPGLNFDPYFEVRGLSKTLAEGVPWEITPRFQAVQALKRWQPITCAQPMTHWKGPWQK